MLRRLRKLLFFRFRFFNVTSGNLLNFLNLLNLLILLQGCSFNREYSVMDHKQEVSFYSSEREVAIGRTIAKSVEKEYPLYNDPTYIARVERITADLFKVCDRQEITYHTYVLDKDTKNAFSIPGGYIYVFKGLMDALGNDQELAYVIAHEMGHIAARHHIKRLQAAWGANLLILASTQVKDSGDLPVGVSNALVFILSGFSQQDELQADGLSVTYMKLAGYNPEASITVLDKLWKFEKKEIRAYDYARTHPYIGLRIKSIKQALGLPLEFKDYVNSLD